RDRRYFHLEASRLLCRLGLVLRRERKGILLFAPNLETRRDIFGSDAHVIAEEGIHKAIAQESVDHCMVTHLHALAKKCAVRCERHRFLPAGYDDVRIPTKDLLHANRYGAQARATKLVEIPGGSLIRNSRLDRGLSSRVLALASGKNLAKDDFVHVCGFHTCPFKCGSYGHGPKVMRRRLRECAVERTDGSAGGTCDNDRLGRRHVRLRLAG